METERFNKQKLLFTLAMIILAIAFIYIAKYKVENPENKNVVGNITGNFVIGTDTAIVLNGEILKTK